MADLASFSLSDRRAAPHSRAHQYRLTAVSATWRGQTAGHAGGREGGEGRGGRGEEGRGGQGRAGGGHFIRNVYKILFFRIICILSLFIQGLVLYFL